MQPEDDPLGELPIHAPHERLRNARRSAGYKSASAAARQFGWGDAAYRHHENGTRTFGVEQAVQYGKAFNVPASWLLDIHSVGKDAWRLPLAKFYVQNNISELSYHDDMDHVAREARKVLGLNFIPELTISLERVDLSRNENGRPIFHFASAELTGVRQQSFDDGFIFATRCPQYRPRGVASEGDLLIVDSEQGHAGERPELWLIRETIGVSVAWLQGDEHGNHMLIPVAGGGNATSLAIDADLVGRIRWIGKKF